MTSLAHTPRNPLQSVTLPGQSRTDIVRVALILMLFVNVSMAIMLLMPATEGQVAPAIQWHGNSTGATIR